MKAIEKKISTIVSGAIMLFVMANAVKTDKPPVMSQ
jgi:hypothetical protein